MKTELREYQAFLTFPPLNAPQHQQIDHAAETLLGGLAVDLTLNSLEYRYSGRDAQQKNVRFFAQIAAIIGNAEGEIVCSYFADDREHPGDQQFEFYTIRNGRLYCQPGSIQRGHKSEVALDKSMPERRPQLVTA